ncbi:acyl-CoA dehydrogenase family protein [Kitasatospora viridis]|uniref:Alkylation response protein AidB-like acyl-CoA dehydrogenase n=1 Tax=Kitasatospora viridis TaxID=281105 RepID=A0A561UCJ4_9ACTN|nr:acyl-CoA dehydrogenase family protein [Kitasatospora viridis]TWF97093.1 alkylation response protein AidB-like acyl-CoA dehydrogenase [Kitasatospora viridis]
MRLELDDVQRDLLLALRAGLGRVAAADGRLDPAEVHSCLAELDLFALELPDDAGGLAFGLDHAAPVCEELGQWAAADPYRAGALFADLLRAPRADGAQHQPRDLDELLPLLATGKLTAGLAAGTGVVATPGTGGWRLHGDCALPDPPPEAAFHLVPVRHGGGTALAVVAVDSPGLGCAPTGRDGVRRLRLAGVTAHALSTPLHDADGLPSPLLVRARIRQAAYLLGLAAGAHRLAVARAVTRRQFDRSIGDNQAVAFPLAEQFARLEAARLLVHEAGWHSDSGGDGGGDSSGSAALGATQSLACTAELALQVTAHAVHVHGAAGIATSSAVQRHYRAAAVEATRWGAPAALWREAGALRLR